LFLDSRDLWNDNVEIFAVGALMVPAGTSSEGKDIVSTSCCALKYFSFKLCGRGFFFFFFDFFLFRYGGPRRWA